MVITLAVLACLCGCQGKSTTTATGPSEDDQIKPSEKLIAAPDSLISDVPVPLGASFNTDSSSSYTTGSRRRIDHNYGIWAKKALVQRFYHDNMGIYGWDLSNSIVSEGMYILSYKKADESCRVIIGPSNWLFQTRIEIIVQPMDDSTTLGTKG